ncbi:MAG: D-TA family PLP-dependent enzyme [Betaproteobacteria bacterium]|nr:D-TA family PLP-dependent enzyme [Betaproteobacteria bacterium]
MANAGAVASPALLLYPDRIEKNLQRMIAMAGGVDRLRPHVKTHKLPQVVALKRAAGIRRFKAATIAEAEMTAAAGGEDILLAYQPVGTNIERLAELMKRYPQARLATLVDDARNLAAIAQVAADCGATFELYVDLNVGMNRTGIAPGDAAASLYRSLCSKPGLKPGGLHAYDGHLHDPDPAALARAVDQAFAPVWKLRSQLRAEGLAVPRVIASGTPTFALLAQHDDVEVGAGTTLLWDSGEEETCPQHQFLNAAVLLCRVVSKPQPDLLCVDLGHKAVASEMPHPRVKLIGLDDAVAVTHSEEHLVVRSSRAAGYRVGEVVYGIPRHICPTVALQSEVWAVRDGRAAERWPVVARARRITI